jgi:hypothetical protein
MTMNRFTNDTDKGFETSGIANILSNYVDSPGICKICDHDQRFKPTFQDIITSIDIITQLLQRDCHQIEDCNGTGDRKNG